MSKEIAPGYRSGRRWPRWLLTGFGLLAVGLVLLRWLPAPPLAGQLPLSTLVRAGDGSLLRLTLASDGQYRLWRPLQQMAPSAIEALLLKEDRFFYWHPGINPLALARAGWVTYVRGHRQGGSTLTMQLARLLAQSTTRELSGKLRQICRAVWLEARYSKQEVLEAYCNLAPMGGNIQGLGAAAQIYFRKAASQLTLAESLTLAVMPQDPTARAGFGPGQQQARQRLAKLWSEQHPADQVAPLLAEIDIGSHQRQLPFLAPHLTDQLLRENPGAKEIDTLIDPRLQRLCERVLKQYLVERRRLGLTNGTVLLVDSRDMAVKVLIGSADYHDAEIHGQVNGVTAKRSPGSTLKPFLYGLALDQGLIHPLSVLSDAPTAFGPFQPENFDGRFAGPIPARDALIRSRNVPAVFLANRVRNPSLYQFLRTAGIAGMRSEEHYGLSLVLGGGEVTMEELAELYAMLAGEGRLRPVRNRREAPTGASLPLLSPEAAFLVRDMLAANPRPDAAGHGKNTWPIAWKTGTSWGFRDAWSVGLVGHYVLAVWLGNFDGHANPALVGGQAAAPLFFRLADALALTLTEPVPLPPKPPEKLVRVEVCAASGDLPNRWCPQTASTWFIPGVSPIRVSTLHRPVLVDTRTGLAACPPYDPANTRLEIFAFWPSNMQRLFQEAGVPRRLPPLPGPDCQTDPSRAVVDESPVVQTPLAGVTYTLRLSKPEERIELSATLPGDASSLYWFADNRYLGRSSRNQTLPWRPEQSGNYALQVVDDLMRSSGRTVAVTYLP